MEEERVIAKVRKLIALAECAAASEGERETALRQAHAMLAKANLDMSSVTAGGQDDRTDGSIQTNKRPWIRHLAHAVGELLFCRYFFSTAGSADQHHFIGRKDNVTTAREMVTYLVQSIRAEARKQFPSDSAYRTSFAKGATSRIFQRCLALRAEAEKASSAAPTQTTTGTSLVLASVYQQEAEANAKYLEDKLKIELVASKNKERDSTVRTGAYSAGRAYGDRVSLNKQIGGTS